MPLTCEAWSSDTSHKSIGNQNRFNHANTERTIATPGASSSSGTDKNLPVQLFDSRLHFASVALAATLNVQYCAGGVATFVCAVVRVQVRILILRVGRPEGKRTDCFAFFFPKKRPKNTEYGTPTLRRTDRRYQKGNDNPLDSAAEIGAPASITYGKYISR
jgi:hypothetical protein